jgi:hypothetical protein
MSPTLEDIMQYLVDSQALCASTLLNVMGVSRRCYRCIRSMPLALLVRALIKAVKFKIHSFEKFSRQGALRLNNSTTATLDCSEEVHRVLGPAFTQLCEDGSTLESDYAGNFLDSIMSGSTLLLISLRKAVIDEWMRGHREMGPQIIACEQITRIEADAVPTYGYAKNYIGFYHIVNALDQYWRLTFRCATCSIAHRYMDPTVSRGYAHLPLASWFDVCGLGDQSVGVDENWRDRIGGDGVTCRYYTQPALVMSRNLAIYENYDGPRVLVIVRGQPDDGWRGLRASFTTYVSPGSVRHLLARIPEFNRPGLSISDAVRILQQVESRVAD